MILSPKTILLGALVLLLVGSAALVGLDGSAAGLGCLAAGSVAMLNFWMWELALRRLVDGAVRGGGAGGATGFVVVKMGGLVLAVFGLVAVFPLHSVLLGVSVVVAAILLNAALVGTGHAVLEEA
jgi:hypothetical protein